MFEEVKTPTFVIDSAKARKNIDAMILRAKRSGALFRPHFKTHQSLEVGRMFREAGVGAITVSSVGMARFFADDGWRDITIAFPVNVREMEEIDELASRVDLGLLVDSLDAIECVAQGCSHRVKLWVKVDLGARRSGVPVGEFEEVLSLLRRIAEIPTFRAAGILTHDSRSYGATGRIAVRAFYDEGRAALMRLKAFCQARGFESLAISYGDTPTASLIDDFSGIDELRPGNFVYYDLQQYEIGSCAPGEIAAAVACPIVGLFPARGEAVVYGGAVHLSRQDQLIPGGRRSFGGVFRSGHLLAGKDSSAPWQGFVEGAYLRSVSQEHGIAVMPPEDLAKLKLGDLLMVCPVHSCLAQDLLRENTIIV